MIFSVQHELTFKSMTEYSDVEIIECLRNRKSYVVHYLVDRYLPMIRLMVTQKGGTGEDAKDIFQDALIIMLQKIDSNELALTCKFKTYLYCICENLWTNILMKRHAAANYLRRRSNDYTDHDFSEIYDNKLYENMFYDMFETLEPLCKKILILYWQEFSAKEIAERLGYKDSYVRKKKCECQGELVGKVMSLPQFKSVKQSKELVDAFVFK
jgi:RNA polymerase sigma factor (sigma-70 family)